MTLRTRADRATITGPERRAYPVQLEVRAQSNGSATVEGYASVTEAPYEMWDMFGDYSEVVRAGAFTKTLSEAPQVQLLLNHAGLAMAYTKAGSLRLSEDDTGLHMSADVNTARSDVRDMLAALTDGAVDEMSFAFRVTRQQWSPDFAQRDITEVSLSRGDVSVVNFGANDATAGLLGVRGMDLDRMDKRAARDLMKRLSVIVVDIDADDGEDADDGDDVACLTCGALNEDDAKFCDQCGAAMPAAASEPTLMPASLLSTKTPGKAGRPPSLARAQARRQG